VRALAGNLLYAGTQWLALVVLARLAGAADVGRLTYALAVGAPLFMLANLQLRTVIATDVSEGYRFADYLHLRLLGSAGALAAVAILAATGPREHAALVLAVGLAKAIEAVGDLFGGALQREERMGAAAVSLAVKGLLGLAAFGGVLLAGGSLAAAALAQAAAWAVGVLAYDLPTVAGGAPRDLLARRLRPARLAALARTSLPLGLAMGLVSAIASVPRYLVERHSGSAELGAYGAVAYLFVAVTLIATAVGQAATPRLARHAAANERPAYLRLTGLLCAGGAALGLAGAAVSAAAGEPLLALLYGRSFAGAAPLLVWAAVAAVPQLVLTGLGVAATAARSFRGQLPVLAAGLAGATVASALLVPRHGALGAIWASGLATLIQLAGYAVLVRRGARGSR
jgi:O-antigen/teichoic acid export membrane protein